MDRPKLSVIVTTHHRANLLVRALESVKALGSEVEIVLCADEGSAETRQVAATHLRDRDLFLSLPGLRGPAGTRNAGLQFATGDWVAFLDDDDTMDISIRDSLLEQLSGDCVYYTNYRKIFEEIDETGTVREVRRVNKSTIRKPVSEIQIRNFITVTSFFAPRNIVSELRFDPSLSMSEDWDFLLQLYGKANFRHVDIVGSNWHILSGPEKSRNIGTRKARAKNYLRICARYPAQEDWIQRGRKAHLEYLGSSADISSSSL